MKRKIFITSALICFVTICLAAMADLSGKWTGQITTPDGNQLSINYVFKVDGNSLTGTGQGDGDPEEIKDGKINGNDITFKIVGSDGSEYPHTGKYFPEGDSISMNLEAHGTKFHATLKRIADK